MHQSQKILCATFWSGAKLKQSSPPSWLSSLRHVVVVGVGVADEEDVEGGHGGGGGGDDEEAPRGQEARLPRHLDLSQRFLTLFSKDEFF